MASSSIGAQGRARVAESVHARAFGDDLVILDLAHGEYFALDEIGAHLWKGLAAGRSPEEVALDIVREHDVEFDQALRDLVGLANELAERGLLIVEPAGA